jgi:hypothetical protein
VTQPPISLERGTRKHAICGRIFFTKKGVYFMAIVPWRRSEERSLGARAPDPFSYL